jgi:hypothetical protein
MPSSVDNYGIARKPVTSKTPCFKIKHNLLKVLKAAKNVSKRYCKTPKNTKIDTNRPPIELGTEIAYFRAKQKKIVQLGLKSSIRAQKPAKKEK